MTAFPLTQTHFETSAGRATRGRHDVTCRNEPIIAPVAVDAAARPVYPSLKLQVSRGDAPAAA